ncbi:MAG: UTRA domain-containing protein [Porticoccaceae bacterium]
MQHITYALPRYAQIKAYIKREIDTGQWKVGQQIPSEHQLAEDFQVSRMTARRAVQELADEGLLERSVGLGTFVAPPPEISFALQMPSMETQFSYSDPDYSNRVISLRTVVANAGMASILGVAEGDAVYQSVVVHLRRGVPLQWEECLVKSQAAPAYIKQRFAKVTPQAYLRWVCPPTKVDHQVQAVTCEPAIADALSLAVGSPCLKITRRCWSGNTIVSVARFIAPGASAFLGTDLGG